MSKHRSPLRIGLIGASSFAEERLLPVVQASEGIALWSVLSRDVERARVLAGDFAAQATHIAPVSLEVMLADPELDAVIIANHDARHAEVAIAAARAGKHVFVEKPLALNLDDARAVSSACREANVRCMVGYHQRFVLAHAALRTLLAEQAIGTVRHLHLVWSYIDPHPMGWRTDPSFGRWWVMAALGTHAIDLAEWLLAPTCGDVIQISALTSDGIYRQQADEAASIMLRFAHGALATLSVSCVDRSRKYLEIVGSQGAIVCRNTLGAQGGGELMVNGVPQACPARNPYEAELAAFCQAIWSGSDFSPGAEDGIRNLAWLEQATRIPPL